MTQASAPSKLSCWTWKHFNGQMVLIIRLQGTLRKYDRIYINYFLAISIIIPPHKLPMQRILLVVIILRMSLLNLKMTNGADLMTSTQRAIFMGQLLWEAKQ